MSISCSLPAKPAISRSLFAGEQFGFFRDLPQSWVNKFTLATPQNNEPTEPLTEQLNNMDIYMPAITPRRSEGRRRRMYRQTGILKKKSIRVST